MCVVLLINMNFICKHNNILSAIDNNIDKDDDGSSATAAPTTVVVAVIVHCRRRPFAASRQSCAHNSFIPNRFVQIALTNKLLHTEICSALLCSQFGSDPSLTNFSQLFIRFRILLFDSLFSSLSCLIESILFNILLSMQWSTKIA